MTGPSYSPEALAFHRQYADLATASGTPLLATKEGRIALTKDNPQLFALVYLAHHLSAPETNHTISFSEMHLDWYRQIKEWATPVTGPREWRRAYVAPRKAAKSTTWFTIAPLWAAAHGHVKFIAAFSDSASQAQTHLATFKRELLSNSLLRNDFPDLCTPARTSSGTPEFNSREAITTKSGLAFLARGADSSSLGMKIGNDLPDLLIIDDIEPQEENYSAELCRQRLNTLRDSILYLNDHARVVVAGTVVMNGSIIHQIVQHEQTPEIPRPQWVSEEKFETHYYPALISNDDGTERSLWPERWSIEELQSIRHTRPFWKNFMNSPMAGDSVMWSKEDITYGEMPIYDRMIISVDPAVTTNRKSDFTAISVLGWSAATKATYVLAAVKKKLSPKATRHECAKLLEEFPEVRVLLVETNQGGDMWRDVLGDLPVRVVEKKQSVKKEVRAEWLLNGYQKREVVHVRPFPELEGELLAFPRGLHDDLVDSVGTGFSFLTGAGKPNMKRAKPSARVSSYV